MEFTELNQNEALDVNGGCVGVTAAILVTLFCAGFAGGIACGLHRKDRK